MKAEALIELGREAEALPVINEVRNRAANSTAMLKYSNGDPVANYNVQPYIDGGELHLDTGLCQTGHALGKKSRVCHGRPSLLRSGSLGIAAEVINAYLKLEKPGSRIWLQLISLLEEMNIFPFHRIRSP